MPALGDVAQLSKRYGGCYWGDNCTYSKWDYYGRWILLAAVIVVAFIVFFLLARRNTRRRRQAGVQPMYGTGWMAAGGNNPQYQNNPQAYNSAPPAYGAPPGQSYPMPQYGYYGNNNNNNNGQAEGVQQPSNVYNTRQPDGDYAPPPGPPPAKH